MKSLHARAALFLLAALSASGCASRKPANFRDVAKEEIKNENLSEPALQSERTILVIIDSERNVFFRKEKVGTTEDTGLLKDKVSQAIERNRRNAKDEEDVRGSGAIFICAPESLKYSDVTKVVDAVREAGGHPIGLQREPHGCDPTR